MINKIVFLFLTVFILLPNIILAQRHNSNIKKERIFTQIISEYSKYERNKRNKHHFFFVIDTNDFVSNNNMLYIGITSGNCKKEFDYWKNEKMDFFLLDSNIVIRYKSDTNVIKLLNGNQPLSNDEIDSYREYFYDCDPKYNDVGLLVKYDGKLITAFKWEGSVAFMTFASD